MSDDRRKRYEESGKRTTVVVGVRIPISHAEAIDKLAPSRSGWIAALVARALAKKPKSKRKD